MCVSADVSDRMKLAQEYLCVYICESMCMYSYMYVYVVFVCICVYVYGSLCAGEFGQVANVKDS
jgi:hypothetical protein